MQPASFATWRAYSVNKQHHSRRGKRTARINSVHDGASVHAISIIRDVASVQREYIAGMTGRAYSENKQQA